MANQVTIKLVVALKTNIIFESFEIFTRKSEYKSLGKLVVAIVVVVVSVSVSVSANVLLLVGIFVVVV